MLFVSAILAWLFVTRLSMVYESYLQSKYSIGQSNYTIWRHLTIEALGFFTTISFVLGLIAMLIGLLET